MKITISIILICISTYDGAHAQQKIKIDLQTPPSALTLFYPQQVSTFLNERDFAISPDGNEIYYTISTPRSGFQTIVWTHQVGNGEWTVPEVVSFAGHYSDLEPVFSPDGQNLFFASNRPVIGNQPKDFDIWKVTRAKNGWGDPVNLGSPVNTSADEFYPSVTNSGRLYFTAQYKTGVGKEDIFVADYVNGHYQLPQPLDTAVNSQLYEFNAFVAPDESFILFTSYGRKDDTGGGDLYISRKSPEGKWKPAQNLKVLNSKQLDYCPYISPDGKILFLTSERHELPVSFTNSTATYKLVNAAYTNPLNGTGNIYWVEASEVLGK